MHLKKKTRDLIEKSNIKNEIKNYYLINDLTNDDIDKLRDIICDELIQKGFNNEAKDEINKYGLFLEDLIDDLMHYIQ